MSANPAWQTAASRRIAALEAVEYAARSLMFTFRNPLSSAQMDLVYAMSALDAARDRGYAPEPETGDPR